MSYEAGARVRVKAGDPDHHTRVPRYARGVDPPRVQTCYAVRFSAADLWGSGDHAVTVDLWESYLDRA